MVLAPRCAKLGGYRHRARRPALCHAPGGHSKVSSNGAGVGRRRGAVPSARLAKSVNGAGRPAHILKGGASVNLDGKGNCVEEVSILGRDDAHDIFNRFAAHYDAPAYVRRALQVQQAYGELLDRCRRQRAEWLQMTRTRLGVLHALSGDWTALRPYLADEGQLGLLQGMYAELEPRLRVPVEPTTSARSLVRALRELCESIERFNRRWAEYLPSLDLEPVNALRAGYNRYFLLEKECAVRSPRLARQGYRPLPPLTVEELFARLPLLPAPQLAH